MIVGSLLLITVAAALLVLGLALASGPLLVGSIALSLVGGLALLFGTRQIARTGGGRPTADEIGTADRRRRSALPGDRRAEALVLVGPRHYHLPNCPTSPDDAMERWSLREAEAKGLVSCGICQPDAVVVSDARAM